MDLKEITRQARLELARRDFFYFCHILADDFYKEEREYLVTLCDTLQALYEGRIIRFNVTTGWIIVKKLPINTDYEVCKKLILNMPPQHGKSRTLVNFCTWIFGKNTSEKIITCSYNDTVASDFSRYTRDGITQKKVLAENIVYSDIFPNTQIKKGNASFEKWALESQHFSYLGAGIGGSITSKGGTILIVDDPIKGAQEAFNEQLLETIWTWYANTFRSRVSAKGGEPIEIVNMTRWSKNDICGKLLESSEANEWYVLRMEAYDKENDKMLCDEVLSKRRYLSQKSILDASIFMANYHQEPVDVKGRLYTNFKTYSDIPKDEAGKPLFKYILNYTDTADEGDDYLCSIDYGVYNKESYVLDVIYTKAPMEITEPSVAKMLTRDNVGNALIESNNGGRGFARNVARECKNTGNTHTKIDWFHQSSNKKSRILSNSTGVMNNIYFPTNWKDRWPEFYDAMNKYQKEGKNVHDDAPDATTGVYENPEPKNNWLV